jgi:hypothetical protein
VTKGLIASYLTIKKLIEPWGTHTITSTNEQQHIGRLMGGLFNLFVSTP